MGLYFRAAVVIFVLTVVAASQTEAGPVPDVEWDDIRDWARSTATNSYSTLKQRAGEGWKYIQWGTKKAVNAAKSGLDRLDRRISDPYEIKYAP